MKIKIQRLHTDAVIPFKGTDEAACYDVVAVGMRMTEDYIEYDLGFATVIPPGYEVVVRPRSSISKYDLSLCNSVGTIDSDYRGEWKARFNLTAPNFMVNPDPRPPKVYKVGDKVAQVRLQKLEPTEWEEVDSLEDSERGEGGFGSTGE